MKSIKQAQNLKGKKVLLRLDLNVPIRDGKVFNDFRIKKILPIINFLKDAGVKIIILSHIGRDKSETLKPVYEYLKNIFDLDFIDNVLSDEALEYTEHMADGQIVMMENLRQHNGEKENNESFAKQIARLGDIYVNEAFANSHREHASVVGIPKLMESFSGILFEREVEKLSQSFDPKHPALVIIGGNKLDTKINFVKKVLENYDNVFVGGALANNFFKEQGLSVGKSFVLDGNFGLSDLMKNQKLILPVDVVVQNEDGEIFTKKPNEVLDGEKILDAGSETVSQLKMLIKDAKFILMNGPLGDYEKGFGEPTEKIVKAISESTAETIIGGGDTTALINDLKIEEKFSFVSTGGGAMLEFLTNRTLSGIKALK
jgi:phosphoglycerate kinase